ncbi:gas vesicle protein GvpL [Halopenitus persicus]|uniref:Gas vesicle synthesis protein GvpL/GvpF n=1 Tax=Halopenitus persicus TaxID=1048396 RepID=A0A1H3LNN5_9EURY|nr:GvpL/GvpF family gas vesicle protein [Halopenitus persicus]SDY65604.1 Gas vesicle synthesis protein GvpL/GvpF [Halopenitus persicus]
MTDHRPSPEEEQTATNEERTISDGRYLYCVVDTTSAEPATLSTTGVDDNSVYVVEVNGVGAVVHDCETVYETEDLEQVKRWLLTHQQVVDAAGDAFGTPLPMRFDTVLEGGDASLERWLEGHYEGIRDELASFTGVWEYRTNLLWDSAPFEETIADQDDQLRELRQRKQQSGAGKRFLLEKQYDQRLQELKRERQTELAEQLEEAITPVVNNLTEQDTNTPLHDEHSSVEKEQIVRFAVLADEDDETALGDRLDTIVEHEGVEIRFTGPWPPYTFAPDIGE